MAQFYSPVTSPPWPSFPRPPPGCTLENFSYDQLVYDTYDYIDKVISLSVTDPICAALSNYFQNYNDQRALILINYIKYGTNDDKKIWLLKYGIDPEDIDWVDEYVDEIDGEKISFSPSIVDLPQKKMDAIKRYLD